MKTVCNITRKKSSKLKKEIVYNFNGGNITSDGGVKLIESVDAKLELCKSIVAVLDDKRKQSKITHTLYNLIQQRLYQITMGYEDCNDANELRNDPAFKIALGKLPESDAALASQPTLTRFENSITKKEIYNLATTLVRQYATDKLKSGVPKRIILDIDATDDPTHGAQQYTLFHGYFHQYMYFPLLVFDGETGDIISSLLRPGTAHSSHSAKALLKRIIKILREYFPDTEFVIRGDAGFGVPEMYDFCEKNRYKYILGLSGNEVLKKKTTVYRNRAEKMFEKTQNKQKLYASFKYQAGSWQRERQVIVKAEYNRHGPNTRYIVTNINFSAPKMAYEYYCQRGKMENYIKDLKNDLFMDRLSCHRYLANCFRMSMSCYAYTLMQELRRWLKGSVFEGKQTNTIRLKLLKIGARVKESVRRVWINFSSSFVYKELFSSLLNDFY